MLILLLLLLLLLFTDLVKKLTSFIKINIFADQDQDVFVSVFE